MRKELLQKLRFETFSEFCERANEILDTFKIVTLYPTFSIKEYKAYIYKHKFSDNKERNNLAKDKIWEWLMSYKYEYMDINDLYSVLGFIKKGK